MTDGLLEIICNEVLITRQTAAERKARNKCQHMANSKQNRNGAWTLRGKKNVNNITNSSLIVAKH